MSNKTLTEDTVALEREVFGYTLEDSIRASDRVRWFLSCGVLGLWLFWMYNLPNLSNVPRYALEEMQAGQEKTKEDLQAQIRSLQERLARLEGIHQDFPKR